MTFRIFFTVEINGRKLKLCVCGFLKERQRLVHKGGIKGGFSPTSMWVTSECNCSWAWLMGGTILILYNTTVEMGREPLIFHGKTFEDKKKLNVSL